MTRARLDSEFGPDHVARVDGVELAKRRLAEAVRVEKVRASGAVPVDCGPVPDAPARGTFSAVQTFALYPDGKDGFARKLAGHMGRRTLHRSDTFEVAAALAARNGKPVPYSPSQVAIGRAYRDLDEWLKSSGIKLSSAFNLSTGGGQGCYMDARLRDSARMDVLRGRIGGGVSMQVRKIRPSSRGSKRSITDRALVDGFCLRQQSVSDILRAHGWIVKGAHTSALQKALALALDRMIGPVRSGVQVYHAGGMLPAFWGIVDGDLKKGD